MEFIAITIANLIWVLYSLSEGLRESVFNHYRKLSKRGNQFNYKIIVNLQRLLILLVTSGILIYSIGWVSIPFIITQLCIFKYFHGIIYRHTYKKLGDNSDKFPIGESKKSLMLFGISLQIFIYLFLV